MDSFLLFFFVKQTIIGFVAVLLEDFGEKIVRVCDSDDFKLFFVYCSGD